MNWRIIARSLQFVYEETWVPSIILPKCKGLAACHKLHHIYLQYQIRHKHCICDIVIWSQSFNAFLWLPMHFNKLPFPSFSTINNAKHQTLLPIWDGFLDNPKNHELRTAHMSHWQPKHYFGCVVVFFQGAICRSRSICYRPCTTMTWHTSKPRILCTLAKILWASQNGNLQHNNPTQ